MRLLRAFVVALLTAIVGCVLAFFVGDYLTRLAHVPEMEGQRGMTVIFLCVPLGILASLVIGIISSILVRRQGLGGFVIAQGWSLLSVFGLAGLLIGVRYAVSQTSADRWQATRIAIRASRAPNVSNSIPARWSQHSSQPLHRNQQSRFAFIDWSAITKNAEHIAIPGSVP
jgi:hypothetical protein